MAAILAFRPRSQPVAHAARVDAVTITPKPYNAADIASYLQFAREAFHVIAQIQHVRLAEHSHGFMDLTEYTERVEVAAVAAIEKIYRLMCEAPLPVNEYAKRAQLELVKECEIMLGIRAAA